MKVLVAVILLLNAVLGDIDSSKNIKKGLIINGQNAKPKQFPYQVFLMIHAGTNRAMCGGALISREWVLTAAHCTENATHVDVYLGYTNRSDESEVGRKIIRAPKENVIDHEKYDFPINDISLIRLPAPIELNDYIQIAILPKLGETSSYVGEDAIASGWGKTKDTAVDYPTMLKWIKVPIMNNTVCGKIWNAHIEDSHVCIDTKCGYKFCNVCNGDSGGPLVLADGSRTVVGIAAFVHKAGCESEYPGVFTRVTSYLDWIKDKTGIANV